MAHNDSDSSREYSGVRIFFLSFGISLAVLIAVVLVVFNTVLGPPGSGQTQGAASSEEDAENALLSYRPAASDGLNLVIISTRERSGTPHAYTLCRFDPASDRILLVPVPPETVVTVKAKTATFAEHYEYAGSANIRLAAESLLLCEEMRYVRLARSGAVNLVDALGGLEHKFSEGYTAGTVEVPAGTHLLNGELLYEVANSPPEGTPAERWRLEMAGELLIKRLDAGADDRMDFLMETFWNNVDTDLSQFDYTSRRKAITSFLNSEERRVEILPLSGEWDREHNEFIPGEAILEQVRDEFCGSEE